MHVRSGMVSDVFLDRNRRCRICEGSVGIPEVSLPRGCSHKPPSCFNGVCHDVLLHFQCRHFRTAEGRTMSVGVVSQLGLMMGAPSGSLSLRPTVPRLVGDTRTVVSVRMD
jgi:hypothetical protein